MGIINPDQTWVNPEGETVYKVLEADKTDAAQEWQGNWYEPKSTEDTLLSDLDVEAPPAYVTQFQPGATPTDAEVPTLTAAPDAVASTTAEGDVSQATASQATAVDGTIDPDTMTASGQLDSILAKDSPLMQRSANEGMLQAGSRGLQNSSFAAGAAMGQMIDKATPLAQQDAATYFQNMRGNVDAQNAIAQLNAKMGTDVSMANAQEINDMLALNNQLETAVSQGNQAEANDIRAQLADITAMINDRNAQRATDVEMQNTTLNAQMDMNNANNVNSINVAAMQAQTDIDTTFMRGQAVEEVADINGKYGVTIAENQVAGQIFGAGIAAIADILSNEDISPERAASMINVIRGYIEGSLGFLQGITNDDLSSFGGGGAGDDGSGSAGLPGTSVDPVTGEIVAEDLGGTTADYMYDPSAPVSAGSANYDQWLKDQRAYITHAVTGTYLEGYPNQYTEGVF